MRLSDNIPLSSLDAQASKEEPDNGDYAGPEDHLLPGDEDASISGRSINVWSLKMKILALVALLIVVASFSLLFTTLFSTPIISSKKLLSFLHLSTDGSKDPINETLYYGWDTMSAFDPVHFENAADLTEQALCDGFPKHLLKEVQPVLKTGHGVLESRVHPQLHAALSCLDDLLIFSDITETFDGRQLEDVIADTPQHLIDGTKQLEPYRRLPQCISSDETADCGEAITPKEGWKIDKFKFLPSINRAWQARPDRKWYFFFEADTYVVWDTAFRLLSNFNSDEPHYFGSPSPGRNGTWFAYGGTGFILSREAMRRLNEESSPGSQETQGSSLIESEWETLLSDCCGDSILGWAMYKRGVELSGLWPLFNPHSPTSIPFSPRYWCQPVLSMHKPGVKELEKLWRWEWRERRKERPLLYRDMALSYFEIDNLDRKQGWTNAAWDDLGFDGPPGGETVETVKADTADACARACEEDAECFSWTHRGDICSLVHSMRIGNSRYRESEEGGAKSQDLAFVAGWAKDRIRAFVEAHECENVQWVRPSTERIF